MNTSIIHTRDKMYEYILLLLYKCYYNIICSTMYESHYVLHSFLAQQGLLSDSPIAEKLANKKLERKR